MAEQIKDLGGLVNKDMAFSKVKENVIYDSKNFRVTTDDGATLAVRTNIKGNSFAIGIPDIPCIDTITVDRDLLNTYFVGGIEYTLQLTVDGTPVFFVFTYLNGDTFITELTDFINTDTVFTDLGISASSNVLASTITLSVPNCLTITYDGFTEGAYGTGLITRPYRVLDFEFQQPNNLDFPLNYNQYYDYTLGVLPQFPSYGVIKDHYWNFDYINQNASSRFTPYFQSRFVRGIFDSASGTWPYRSETAILYRDFGDSRVDGITDTNSRVLLFNAGVENVFPIATYTTRTLNYTFAYYIGKLDSDLGFTNATLRVLAECEGTWPSPPTSISYTNMTETGTTTEYSDLVELFSTNITQSNDYIASPVTFSYFFPNGVTPRRYVISIELDPIDGSKWNAELYLAKFIVEGPFLSVPVLNITNTSSGITAPQIIGWTTLRGKNTDNIYLLTTDGTFNPDDSTTGPFTSSGQWWKFTYPKEGDYSDPGIYSLTLIYNNQLNLTTYRPVANPGMIESRYENEFIQKIYWTDNYNVPRVINVADPNAASLTVEDLNLQPSLSMDMPLITEVLDGGSLLLGVYQVAYRLKNTNGSETRFSRTSQLIPIIDANEANATILNYFPRDPIIDTTTNPSTNTVANKSIRVDVSNINTTYDTIEFALIYYQNSTDIPSIDIVKETFIPDNGIVSVIITGAETPVPITVDELTAFTTAINTAKTLAAKKQTLFLGNITLGSQIVDWDARAYRFPNSESRTIITDLLGNSYTIDFNSSYEITEINGGAITPMDVPYNYDCIQDYNSQAPTSSANYLYKPNSDILGGAGPNVSYEFVTETLLLDNKYDTAASGVYSPHLTVDSYYNIVLDQDPYFKSKGISMSNNASPYVYDIFVGYRRDEMERFGIVFFDELDNPTYVNWIADIRMPHIYMPDGSYGTEANPSLSAPYLNGSASARTRIGVGSSTFSSDIAYYDTTNKKLYAKPLGVRFTIDFSGVPSKYKKASIVRVPKKEEDKHIIGQGAFTPAWKYFGNSTDPEDTGGVFLANPHLSNYLDPTRGTAGADFNDTWYDCWSFHSPEFLFKGFTGDSGNDAIDIVSLYNNNAVAANYAWHGENAGGGNFYELDGYAYGINDCYFAALRSKAYENIETNAVPASIKDAANLSNPYSVIQAVSLERGGSDRKFNTGVTAINNPLSGISMTRTVRNCSPKELTAGHGGGVDGGGIIGIINGYSIQSKSVFVQLQWDKALNFASTHYNGDDYLMSDGFADNTAQDGELPVYIANYKRILAPGVQFGGNDYFARANNTYIPCNNLIDISDRTNPITTKVFGGDTKVTVLDHVTQFFDYAEGAAFGGAHTNVNMIMQFHPVETTIAVDYRRSANSSIAFSPSTQVPNRCQYIGIPGAPNDALWYTSPRMANTEHFEVDDVYNHTDKSVYSYFPAPALGRISGIYDCRIWKSEPKIDGELVESWSIFKPSAYKDVESAYGPINNLVIFQDKMFYFQDRAFGIAQVDEQKLLQNGNSSISDLVLGSSGILERYDYISTKTGTKHQFSMSVSDYAIIWFDILGRKMYRYKPSGLDPVSDIKGFNAFLYNNTAGDLQIWDNPYLYKGIHSTYDFRHNEFYTTFVTEPYNVGFTLVYNDLLDGFIGEYTHMPKVYINDKTNIFSPEPYPDYPIYDQLFIHNYGDYGRFYGNRASPAHSSVSFIINQGPNVEKVLTNLEVIAEAYSSNTEGAEYNALAATDFYDFFNSMRIFNNYQNTDWQDLSTLARKHKTVWNIKVPSDRTLDTTQNIFSPANLAVNKPRLTKRLKDKWFMVELEYNNSSNNKLVVHTAKAIFTANSR